MKRCTLFALFFCLVICQLAEAQIFRERNRNTYIGFRGGYSIATWSGFVFDIPDLQFETIPGYHGGFFISVRIADNFTIEPGIQYSAKGWSVSGTLNDGQTSVEGTLTNKINYIDAPLMFRVFLKGFNLGVGPQISLPLTSDLAFEGTVNGQSGSSNFSNIEELNDFDVAVALSIGYEFDFGLSLHATYDLGLTGTAALYPYPVQFPLWTEANSRVIKLSIAFIVW
jgi:hypothetical protein